MSALRLHEAFANPITRDVHIWPHTPLKWPGNWVVLTVLWAACGDQLPSFLSGSLRPHKKRGWRKLSVEACSSISGRLRLAGRMEPACHWLSLRRKLEGPTECLTKNHGLKKLNLFTKATVLQKSSAAMVSHTWPGVFPLISASCIITCEPSYELCLLHTQEVACCRHAADGTQSLVGVLQGAVNGYLSSPPEAVLGPGWSTVVT